MQKRPIIKNYGLDQVPRLCKKHFDLIRFRDFLALTFVLTAVVTGAAGYLSGTLNSLAVIWQSLVIALLVGTGAGWMAKGSVERPAAGRTSTARANDDVPSKGAGEPDARTRALESLEEQGITIKLLELTALGERYGNVFSVAMIGVDHIDDISENYDRDVIDDLMSKVSNVLAHTLRMPDRVGAFEHGTYLVVLPETKLPGAIQIAERLRAAVSGLDLVVSERIHIHTTASVGVTSFRRGDDLQSLVERAEKALRSAQSQGRNRVLPDMAA